ncbi:MAG: ABC transporter substrate-binding protein [Planctomycetota bacterium]
MRGWILLAMLVGCGSGEEPGEKSTDGNGGGGTATVIYAGSAWYGHAPVWVGIREGIFQKAGFEVVRKPFGGSSARIQALSDDNATFASLGEIAMLEAMSRGERRFYWIGSQNIAPGNEGLVGIGIDSIADLKGKRIALYINTSIHLTVAALLKAEGLDIQKDVTILNAKDDAVVNLVRNGDAQAGAIWEPFFTDLRGLKDAKVLGTDKDTEFYREFKTMSGPDVICASKKWVDADAARARRFFRAYFEAVQWCEDHPDELLELVAKEVRKPKDAVRTALANFTWIGWEGQAVMLSDRRMFGQAERVCQWLKDLDKIESTPVFRDWTRLDLFQGK